jgi:hypothetical protein
MKLPDGSTKKELKLSPFARQVWRKPKEAVKQEIGDIFEELNHQMEINCMCSGYIKDLLYPPELSKRSSNSRRAVYIWILSDV